MAFNDLFPRVKLLEYFEISLINKLETFPSFGSVTIYCTFRPTTLNLNAFIITAYHENIKWKKMLTAPRNSNNSNCTKTLGECIFFSVGKLFLRFYERERFFFNFIVPLKVLRISNKLQQCNVAFRTFCAF